MPKLYTNAFTSTLFCQPTYFLTFLGVLILSRLLQNFLVCALCGHGGWENVNIKTQFRCFLLFFKDIPESFPMGAALVLKACLVCLKI